jgi:hypothetical protein
MSISSAAVAIVISVAVGGIAVYSYLDIKKENKLLKMEVNNLKDLTEAHSESGKVKNDQTTGIRKVEVTAANIAPAVTSLRKSAAKAPRDSVEACHRSLTVAGEVLGECAERYLQVARKAELLQVDLKAIDAHADIIEGLISDITGMEPIK